MEAIQTAQDTPMLPTYRVKQICVSREHDHGLSADLRGDQLQREVLAVHQCSIQHRGCHVDSVGQRLVPQNIDALALEHLHALVVVVVKQLHVFQRLSARHAYLVVHPSQERVSLVHAQGFCQHVDQLANMGWKGWHVGAGQPVS